MTCSNIEFKFLIRFDILNQRWNPVAAMPRRLRGCVAIELKGKIYVAGGKGDDHNCSNAIYRFQPHDHGRGEWEELTYLHGFNETICVTPYTLLNEIIYLKMYTLNFRLGHYQFSQRFCRLLIILGKRMHYTEMEDRPRRNSAKLISKMRTYLGKRPSMHSLVPIMMAFFLSQTLRKLNKYKPYSVID